jgi:hypothetical protein
MSIRDAVSAGPADAATTLLFRHSRIQWKPEFAHQIMADSPSAVKYRVVGIREDGKHVSLCSYVSLEVTEKVATLEQSRPEFTTILIESDEEVVRRARICPGRLP